MGEVRTYTYRELLDATQRFASSLKGLGVKISLHDPRDTHEHKNVLLGTN
jgi:acyl-CoA synthetase (AMP-forming)/AMP-acid ligase II